MIIDLTEINKERHLYYSDAVELTPGITFLVGCNGAGKTTLCKEVENYCKENKILGKFLYCKDTFSLPPDVETAFSRGIELETILTNSVSSEYEGVVNHFYDWIKHVRPGDNFKDKEFVIIIDGLDSGSDTVFQELHSKLFNTIITDGLSRGVKMYLIITTNNFVYLTKEYTESAKALYVPSLVKKDVPAYKEEEFSLYKSDITESARLRKFNID